MNHYLYLLKFPNGKKYIGARSTTLDPELDTMYLGSGKALPKDRHETRDVEKIIIDTYLTREELLYQEKKLIKLNDCVASDEWYNLRLGTFDRHGQKGHEPWNKGSSDFKEKLRATLAKRRPNGGRTPAQIDGARRMRIALTGVKNPAKALHGVKNNGFNPWYYITPEGEYFEVHDKTKAQMAGHFGLSERQMLHRFHHTNIHKKCKHRPIKGYTFGNLPRPKESAED